MFSFYSHAKTRVMYLLMCCYTSAKITIIFQIRAGLNKIFFEGK